MKTWLSNVSVLLREPAVAKVLNGLVVVLLVAVLARLGVPSGELARVFNASIA
jgi:hypothetical protein